MSIHARVHRLENVVRARPKDCLGCGAPSRVALRVVETDHDDPLPACPICGRLLDLDGTPLPNRFKRFIRGDR
jgi:hypothetical protein